MFAVVLCVIFGCSAKTSSRVESDDLNSQLFAAVLHDDLKAAKAALVAGANANYNNCIFDADSPEMLSLMIKYGADVNSRDVMGYTLLQYDCLVRSDRYIAEIVKVLLEAGANPNARGWRGRSAMHDCHDANAVKLLIDYGGDVNAQDENGITPLREAICQREFDLIQLLLDAGADPDLRDKTGKSSREYALEHKCCEFVQGSMIKIENPTRRATQKMLQAIPEENIKAMKKALDKGVDPNWIEFRESLLYMSVRSPKVTKVLLDAGADPNIGNDDGETPLHLAVLLGKVETAKLLLEAGADPNICPAGHGTPVFYAHKPELIHLLKQYGGDMNFTVDTMGDWYGPKGITPLMWKVRRSPNIKVLSALLEAGADPDARDAEGKSARDYANRRGSEELKKLFRQH